MRCDGTQHTNQVDLPRERQGIFGLINLIVSAKPNFVGACIYKLAVSPGK